MGWGSLNPFRSSSPLNPVNVVKSVAGAAEDVVSGVKDVAKDVLSNPVAQVALAYYAPGFGEMIAADLGVSSAVGTAIAKVGIQTASGVPLEQAILNAGVDAGVSSGVKDISPEVRKAFTDNPGLADAVTSAGASAVKTVATGGNGDEALKAAVAGAAGSTVTTATGDKVLGAATTGYATGGVTGAATAASGALGAEAAAIDKAAADKAKADAGIKVAGPLDISGVSLTSGQDAYLKSPLPAGYALAPIEQVNSGKAVSVELPSGQYAWVIQTSPDAKPLPAASVQVKEVANFPQVGIDFSTTDQNVASNLSAILKVNQGSQGQALGGAGSYGLANIPVSFVGKYGDQSVFETSGGDRFSLINVGDRTGVQDKFGNVVWVDQKVAAELSNVATVAVEMAKATEKPVPTTQTTEQIYKESATESSAGGGGGGGGTDAVVVSDKTPTGTSTTSVGGVATGNTGTVSTAGASGASSSAAGGASSGAKVSDTDIKNYVLANIANPADIAAAASKYGVSVADLSRATGVSVDAVNKYFGDAGVTVPGTVGSGAASSGAGTGSVVDGTGGGSSTGGAGSGTGDTGAGTGGSTGGAGAGGEDTSGSSGTGGGTGGGVGTGDGTGEGPGAGDGVGDGVGEGTPGAGRRPGGTPRKKDPTNITVTTYKAPAEILSPPSTFNALGSSPLQQALTAYRPAGEIEDVSTGKKRENVWNEASLRLKDALGI
jgi:hypothetical protein